MAESTQHTAWTMYTASLPKAAMSAPASAGPPMVAISRADPLQEIACVRCSGATVCGSMAEVAGHWNARAVAVRNRQA